MALTVNTNLASAQALSNLDQIGRSLNSTFNRLSTGLRINSAADDAAGLSVAESLDADNRSVRQAVRNANDGVSLIQTAEGASAEVGSILKRMRELAVQASTGTLSTTERGYINTEFGELESEIDRIAITTNFNGVAISDGSTSSLDIQVGINDSGNDRIRVSLGDLSSATLAITASNLSTAANAQSAISVFDTALDSVNGYRSTFGAAQNRLESTLRNLESYSLNLSAAQSRIQDADFAYETAQLAKYRILQDSAVSVLAQANSSNSGVLRLVG